MQRPVISVSLLNLYTEVVLSYTGLQEEFDGDCKEAYGSHGQGRRNNLQR